jgi:hypothetical protein
MSEAQDGRPDQPANRAADMGEQVGRFAILAVQRIEGIIRGAVPSQPSRKPSETGPGSGSAATSDASATRRAEEMLNGMGERLNQLVSLAGPRVRKLAALAREEAEDIWAEAQHVRTANDRSQPGSGTEIVLAETPPRAV